MRRLLVVPIAIGLVVAMASAASAHNIFSTLYKLPPSLVAGYKITFYGSHDITGCVDNGDGEMCVEGFRYNVWTGAQICLNTSGGTCASIGKVVKRFGHHPEDDWVSAIKTLYCLPADVGKTFYFRTRVKGGVKHLGSWSFTGFEFSLVNVITCQSAAPAVEAGDQPSLSAIYADPSIMPDVADSSAAMDLGGPAGSDDASSWWIITWDEGE
jgi:hypothetical protein